MPSAFDAQIEQLTHEAQAFVDAWSELVLLPLVWLGAAGGAATRYRSDEFSVPPLPVDRTLVPGPLTIGIPRAGYPPEQIPAGAAGGTQRARKRIRRASTWWSTPNGWPARRAGPIGVRSPVSTPPNRRAAALLSPSGS